MSDFRATAFPAEISMEGFQVVPGLFFSKQVEPTMTIWSNAIAFNTMCFSALNDCVSIQLMVNGRDRKVVVTPCQSKDKDAIAWSRPTGKQTYRKIDCARFAQQLFDIWGLKKEYHYRVSGKVVSADNRIMLMFDFSAPEKWQGQRLVTTIGE